MTTMVVDTGSLSASDYFSLDELLTEKERGIRDRVRTFCDADVIPVINSYWQNEEFPFEPLPKIATRLLDSGLGKSKLGRHRRRLPRRAVPGARTTRGYPRFERPPMNGKGRADYLCDLRVEGRACLRAPEVREEGSKTGEDPRYV
jgi:hypothetical protein